MTDTKYEVYYLREEEWWQKQLPEVEKYIRDRTEQTEEIVKTVGFERLYDSFETTKNPRFKATCFVLLCIVIKKNISGNLPFYPLKVLYGKCPINYEGKWSISAIMHIAKDIPRDELVWLNSLPCHCSDFPYGYAPE